MFDIVDDFVGDIATGVQEYIKESAGEDIRAFVVGSRVVASMKRQSLDDDFRSNLHKGGEAIELEATQAPCISN